MSKRLSIVGLLIGWLCASGTLLNGVQAYAWATMFAGYVRTMSVEAAATETFNGEKPCPICMAVRQARDEKKHAPPSAIVGATEKLVLVCHEIAPVILGRPTEPWPEPAPQVALMRRERVPVPPPRAGLSAAV